MLNGFNRRAAGMSALVAAGLFLAACGEDKGTVAATVNGKPIYEQEVSQQLATLPANLVEGREADIKRQLTEALVQQSLMQQEAEKLNIEKDAEFQDALEKTKQQLLSRFVLKHKIEQAVTDEAIAAAYAANKARLTFPAVKARHILVGSEQEARELIRTVTPENFAAVAREKSIGPSKEQGGDLGWFRKEAMIPAFADVAFKTPAGNIAKQPVQTQFGWHVVLVEATNDNFEPPLEAVKEQIRQELAQEVVAGVMRELRTEANVVYNDPDLAPVQPAAMPAEAMPAAGQ